MEDIEIKSFWDEEWLDLKFDNLLEKSKYKISNYGKVMSFYYNERGVLLKSGGTGKYKTFIIKDKFGNKIRWYIHRLVATLFLEEPTEIQTQVIHIDNNKHNNYYKNLKWASEKEKRVHQDISMPGWQNNGKEGFRAYSKLTESQVKLIKRKINDPNRKTRMKIIARRYGVSVMQLYRIKSGENWSSVSPD
ncbi:MAG: HNH endonuclease [Bacteroidales bacterium]|jgi:hypothetical protein|nr:HNH endonuclease [Bacteroidales bacterium]